MKKVRSKGSEVKPHHATPQLPHPNTPLQTPTQIQACNGCGAGGGGRVGRGGMAAGPAGYDEGRVLFTTATDPPEVYQASPKRCGLLSQSDGCTALPLHQLKTFHDS